LAARAVLTEHERVVLEAAAARLVPGPDDDPSEAGHPGAREAHAANYIVMLLGALREDPPKVFAGGPFSDRAGGGRDDMARFLPLNDAVKEYWRVRLDDLAAAYHDGLAARCVRRRRLRRGIASRPGRGAGPQPPGAAPAGRQ